MTVESELPFLGALDAVREIEAAIEARDSARDAASSELEEARAEAARLLLDARRVGALEGQDRRREVLAVAEAEATAIRTRGVATAEQLLERVSAQGPHLLGMLVPVLLPEEW